MKILGMDRSKVKWEDHILDMSPVEKHGDIWLKREDKFAPLGYGNINGSKLRVCTWLIAEYANKARNPVGVIQGAVTGSPQHPMVAINCAHFGLPSVHVVGTKDIDGHKNLEIAARYGATFEVSKVGYAKTLEATAYKLAQEKYAGYFVLETNITVNEDRNPADRIEAFHNVGSVQVANMPDHIETLIVPAGSCNSVTSVLYGIARYKPKNLKKILLMGIGNYGSKDPDFIRRRLQTIQQATTVDTDVFDFSAIQKESSLFTSEDYPYIIEHHNLNGSGYCEYNDLMPFTYDDVQLHPRYEGKIFNYMRDNKNYFDKYMNDKTMFWIVGSEPNL